MADLTRGSDTINLDNKLIISDELVVSPPPNRRVEQAEDGTVWAVVRTQRRRFPLRVRMDQADYDALEAFLLDSSTDTISYTAPQLAGQMMATTEDDLYYAGDLEAISTQGDPIEATFTLLG